MKPPNGCRSSASAVGASLSMSITLDVMSYFMFSDHVITRYPAGTTVVARSAAGGYDKQATLYF